MLVNEILNPPLPRPIQSILNQIDFIGDYAENLMLMDAMRKRQIKPTIENMKLFLLRCLVTPIHQLSPTEKTLIRLYSKLNP